MNTNRKDGLRFEAELCNTLSDKGFWAHDMTQNQAGQPADVIAVKDGRAYLIDCKVCKLDRFLFSRIEPNQESAMTLWASCGNRSGWFALKMSNGEIYMISHSQMKWAMKRSYLTPDDITDMGTPLERWMKNCILY